MFISKKRFEREMAAAGVRHSDEIAQITKKFAKDKEQFISILHKTHDDLIEYYPKNDTLMFYRFSKEQEGFERVHYMDYKAHVEAGTICHSDDTEAMLDFLTGKKQSPFTVRMKTAYYDDYIYTEITPRLDFDENCELERVIAVSKDITAKKNAELLKSNAAKYDPVTKFPIFEYGEAHLKRAIAERGDRRYIYARISISNSPIIRSKYGNYYYDAVLDEIGVIMRKILDPEDVILRRSIDEFFMLKKDINSKKAYEIFEKLREDIELIHAGGKSGTPLRCLIGIADSDFCFEKSTIRYGTGLALCAAGLGGGLFGSVAFYKDVLNDKEAIKSYDKIKQQSNKRKASTYALYSSGSGYDPDDNIPTFALNIFEKTNGFSRAIYLLLLRAGRIFNMKRIIVYDITPAPLHINAMFSWQEEGFELPVKNIDVTKNDLLKITDIVEVDGYIKAAADYRTESKALEELLHVIKTGESLLFPLLDGNEYTGYIAYESAAKISNKEDIICLKELSKITSAYISKFKTAHENRAKSEFLSRISHEIRTPMNAIIGVTYLALTSGEANQNIATCLKKIDSSAHYLLTLINDILDMARIESGKVTIMETYFNLNTIISQLDDMIRIQTDKKDLNFVLKNSTKTVHLTGDPLKLNQVLINILGNAVKFTEKGEITFSITEEETEYEDVMRIIFSIKDTGIGISRSALKRIFNTFEQASGDISKKYGGTGLGLSISDSLITMMGGALEVQSEVGVGTEFSFSLNFNTAKEIPADEKITPANPQVIDFNGRIILVAEDDDLNFEIVQSLLKSDNIICERAEDGKAAVEKFLLSELNYYSAIFMDIRMPVMNGLEATKAIRSLEREDAARVPIIAMSANAFEADIKKSLDSGMNSHCSKPIDIRKLRDLLAKTFNN